MAAARSFFRPEFLNRLDEMVVFEPLSQAQLLGIARLIAGEWVRVCASLPSE